MTVHMDAGALRDSASVDLRAGRQGHFIPQATLDRCRRLAEIHPLVIAAQICGISESGAHRARARGWKANKGGLPRRPRPDDFDLLKDKMTKMELRLHYRTSQKAIYRWLEESGPRDYQPRYTGHTPHIIPSKSEIEARIARLGVTAAAKDFGVSPGTFERWRIARGIPVARKRFFQMRKQPTSIGWVERYVQERRAGA